MLSLLYILIFNHRKENTIFTERILPKEIHVYNRALHRFPLNHPNLSQFLSKIKVIEAGFIGETYADQFFIKLTSQKSCYF